MIIFVPQSALLREKVKVRIHNRTEQIMGQEEWKEEWLKITSKRTKIDKECLGWKRFCR